MMMMNVWRIAGRRAFTSAAPSAAVGVKAQASVSEFPSGETKISLLSNGMQVATQDWPGATSTVGVHIAAGVREMPSVSQAGVSDLLSKMLFHGTKNRSALKITRDIEQISAMMVPASTRENMMIASEVLREDVGAALENIADLVTEPTLEQYMIASFMNTYKHQMSKVPDEARMEDAAHEAAYGNQSLGIPLLPTMESLEVLEHTDAVQQYHKKNFVPERMVLAGLGVSHEETVEAAELLFGHLKNTGSSIDDVEAVAYRGGHREVSHRTKYGLAHVYLGFDFGGWTTDQLVPALVLQTLLGGGKSFSTGGPGKGMYTRLYRDALCQHHWINHAVTELHPYRDTSLFGVHGMAAPDRAQDLVAVIAEQLALVAQDGGLDDEEVSRAKNRFRFNVLQAFENKMSSFEDLGASVLFLNERKPVKYFLDKIEKMQPADLTAIAQQIVKDAKPTMVVMNAAPGCSPCYSDVEKYFS